MDRRMIYCIFVGTPGQFESVYVGRTKNLRRRMTQHGHPPFWGVLETIEGFELACSREEYWVQHFEALGVEVLNKYRPRRCPDVATRSLKRLQWLHAALAKHGDSDECLLWPYSTCGDGYGQVPIGGGKSDTAHRIAWRLAHHGEEIPAGLFVLHADRCTSKRCFNQRHLTVGTRRENIDDAMEAGVLRGPGEGTTVGEKNGRAVLTQAKVMRIRELFSEGASNRVLAKQFGVGKSTIQRITAGDTWSHLPRQMPRTEKSISTCLHLSADFDVRLDWINEPGAHMLVVMARCSECKVPFEFIGVAPGMRFDTPMMSANRIQLRCPVKPLGVDSPVVPESANQYSVGASKLQ